MQGKCVLIKKTTFAMVFFVTILTLTTTTRGAEQTKVARERVDALRLFAEKKFRDEYQFEACSSLKDCIFLAHELGWSNREMLDLFAQIDSEPARKPGSLQMEPDKSFCVRELVIYSLPFLKIESIGELKTLEKLLRFFENNAPDMHRDSLDRLVGEAKAIKTSSQSEIAVQINGLMALAQCYRRHIPALRAKKAELLSHCLELCNNLQPPDSVLRTNIFAEILTTFDSNDSLTEREFTILRSAYEEARDLTSRGAQLPRGNAGVTFQLLTRNCDAKTAEQLLDGFRKAGSPGASPELLVSNEVCAAWIKTRAGDLSGAEICFQQAAKSSEETVSYNRQLSDYARVARLAWELKTNSSGRTVQELDKFIAKLASATTSPGIYEPAAVGLLGRYYMSKGDWGRAKVELERANDLFAKYQHTIEDRGIDQAHYLIDLLGGDEVPDQLSVPVDLDFVYAKLGSPRHAVVHASGPYRQERTRLSRRVWSYYPTTLSGLSEKEASKLVDDRIDYLLKNRQPLTDPTSEYIWLASLCQEQGFLTKAQSCLEDAAKNEFKWDIAMRNSLNCARLELCLTKRDFVTAREILNSWTIPEEIADKNKTGDAPKLEAFRQIKKFFEGRVEIAAGNLQQGCDILSEALPRWKDDSEYDSYYLLAVCDLGDAYASLGKIDEAKAAYELALASHRKSLVGHGGYRLLVELALVRRALLETEQNQRQLADRTIFDALSNGERPHSGLIAARLQESAGLVYAAIGNDVRASRFLRDALMNYQLALPGDDARLTRCREEFEKVSATLKNGASSSTEIKS